MSTIVVGVDGSHESVAALRYALREAHLHGEAVKAVAAWHVPAAAYGVGLAPALPDPSAFRRAAEESLGAAIAAVRATGDEGEVESVVREGEAAEVLLAESEGADQLVVGCRDMNLLGRLLHHSVSGRCSRAAHCPVTVVHGG